MDAQREKGHLFINEIFYSIQGEGSFIGWPCIFIRLMGCNLRCSWCDTTYSFYEGKKQSFYEILEQIKTYNCKLIEVTGGEPLIQKETLSFLNFLKSHDYKVLLETSGSISIEHVPDEVHIVMDLKAPGSGESKKNLFTNINYLKASDDLKIVISNKKDFYWAEKIYFDYQIQNRLKKPAIIQSVFDESKPLYTLSVLASLLKESKAFFRMGVQLHKLIYPNKERGV